MAAGNLAARRHRPSGRFPALRRGKGVVKIRGLRGAAASRCGITILSVAGFRPYAQCNESDPRLSTLTQDAAGEGSSVFRRSNRGQKQFGRIGGKVTPIVQQRPGDPAHPAGDDGDGRVGLLAAGTVLSVEVTEVRGAADGHPSGLDERPFQPAIRKRHHPAMGGLAAGTVGGGDQSSVAAG